MLSYKQLSNRRKLVAALRSGKYKRGIQRLRTEGGGFCCLGVACDIISPRGWIRSAGGWLHRNERDFPDGVIAAELGFAFSDIEALAHLNDLRDSTFAAVADAIELITLADCESEAGSSAGQD